MGDEVRAHASSIPDRAHDPQPLRRRRGNSQQSGSTSPQPRLSSCSGNFDTATVLQYDVITKPENELEVQRMVNNHMVRSCGWLRSMGGRFTSLSFFLSLCYCRYPNYRGIDST